VRSIALAAIIERKMEMKKNHATPPQQTKTCQKSLLFYTGKIIY